MAPSSTKPAAIEVVKPAVQLTSAETPKPAVPSPAPAVSNNPLADGLAKKEAGELIAARRILNSALLSGKLSPADADKAKQIMAEINQTVVFSPKRFSDDPYAVAYTVQNGDMLSKISDKVDISWEAALRFNGMTDARKIRGGQVLKLFQGPFNAIVTKSKFTMDIYLGPVGEPGSMYIRSFNVGLGKDDSTPPGTWLADAGKKLKDPVYYSTRGEGVIAAKDPKNPLGTRWIGLAGIDGQAVGKASYGIHGTIDPASIGKQESMGCIRLINSDVELVYDLLIDGKSVVIVKE
jgi:LysM repeat protein